MVDTIGSEIATIAVETVTIGAGSALSGTQQSGLHLVGIQVPSGWTTAGITFNGSADNLTFQPVYDNNDAEVVVQAQAGCYHAIPPTTLPKVPYIQVRSGTSGTPVNQVSAVSIQLVFARYN
jgi:hypothetical protein